MAEGGKVDPSRRALFVWDVVTDKLPLLDAQVSTRLDGMREFPRVARTIHHRNGRAASLNRKRLAIASWWLAGFMTSCGLGGVATRMV